MSQFQFAPRAAPIAEPRISSELHAPGPAFLMKGVRGPSDPIEHRLIHGAVELSLKGYSHDGKNVATITIHVRSGETARHIDVISLSNPSSYSAHHKARGFGISIIDQGHSARVEISASRRAARDFDVPRTEVTYTFELRPGDRPGEHRFIAMKDDAEVFAGEIRAAQTLDVRP